MQLEKATIEAAGEAPIKVLFNPTEYSLDGSTSFTETAIPGLGAPLIQFAHGQSRKLNMELFFDSYEDRSDVRIHTERIYDLIAVRAGTHAPPICTFNWAKFSFRGVVTNVNGKFVLFLSDGTPVRASLTVSMTEYIDPKDLVRRPVTQSSDHTKTRVVQRGDTITGIAAEEYEDPRHWRAIADANRIVNPRDLQPGQVLVIPPII